MWASGDRASLSVPLSCYDALISSKCSMDWRFPVQFSYIKVSTLIFPFTPRHFKTFKVKSFHYIPFFILFRKMPSLMVELWLVMLWWHILDLKPMSIDQCLSCKWKNEKWLLKVNLIVARFYSYRSRIVLV